MPRYEYKCEDCEKTKELIHSMNDVPEVKCETCGTIMYRVIGNFSFVVPGSTNRDIDCVVGADAERRWENIHKRKSEREKTRIKESKEKK